MFRMYFFANRLITDPEQDVYHLHLPARERVLEQGATSLLSFMGIESVELLMKFRVAIVFTVHNTRVAPTITAGVLLD